MLCVLCFGSQHRGPVAIGKWAGWLKFAYVHQRSFDLKTNGKAYNYLQWLWKSEAKRRLLEELSRTCGNLAERWH